LKLGKKTINKYEILIYWTQEDERFIAEVQGLPGCMADGKSYKEALANVEVIIQGWIETIAGLKRQIPQAKGKLMYV
jgi:predicted RNase H-like HicB family nuclease